MLQILMMQSLWQLVWKNEIRYLVLNNVVGGFIKRKSTYLVKENKTKMLKANIMVGCVERWNVVSECLWLKGYIAVIVVGCIMIFHSMMENPQNDYPHWKIPIIKHFSIHNSCLDFFTTYIFPLCYHCLQNSVP